MRLLQTLGNLAMEDPDLLTPVLAGIEQLRAVVALALAETVRLAEIDRRIAAVQPGCEVAIDQLLDVRIRQAILRLAALRFQPCAADQGKVLRMRLEVLFRRNGPLPGVAAEDFIDARKAVVRQIVEAAARGMRRVDPQHRRLLHIQVRRNGHRLHRQELDGRRSQQIDLRRRAHGIVRGNVGIQESHAGILPQEVHDSLRGADAVPVRTPLVLRLAASRMIMPGDDHIPADDPVHIAPIAELRQIHALLLREPRVAEKQGRLRGVPLALGDDRNIDAIRLERRLHEPRRLTQAFRQRLGRQLVRQHDLIIRLAIAQQHEVGGRGRRGEKAENQKMFHG